MTGADADHAICSYHGDIEISGGSIHAASARHNGIIAIEGKITIGSGVRRVEAEGNDSAAIYADDGISVAPELEVTQPAGAVIKGHGIYYPGGTKFTPYVLIERATGEEYPLWVGTTQVNDGNKDDILGDGRASFNSSTNTLTLNDPNINSFFSLSYSDQSYLIYAHDMDLNVKGSCCNKYDSLYPDYGIYLGGGKLSLSGDFMLRSGMGSTVYASGDVDIKSGYLDVGSMYSREGVIRFHSDVDYFNAYATVRCGGGIIIQSPLQLTYPEGGRVIGGEIYQSDGENISTIVEIMKPGFESYDVYVGWKPVTSANKNDILKDGGKAKFDPNTKTLTLSDPVISTVSENLFDKTVKIYAKYTDLTVKGSYSSTTTATNYGIDVYEGSLTLDGDFTISDCIPLPQIMI